MKEIKEMNIDELAELLKDVDSDKLFNVAGMRGDILYQFYTIDYLCEYGFTKEQAQEFINDYQDGFADYLSCEILPSDISDYKRRNGLED